VLVDRLVGHQDVVVKGLDPSLGRPDVVSGTTILGDGRVACILDAAGIVAQREAA
jgi:two-component system chemotaxis sensor kinase CheA